jgi:hypothetical protein
MGGLRSGVGGGRRPAGPAASVRGLGARSIGGRVSPGQRPPAEGLQRAGPLRSTEAAPVLRAGAASSLGRWASGPRLHAGASSVAGRVTRRPVDGRTPRGPLRRTALPGPPGPPHAGPHRIALAPAGHSIAWSRVRRPRHAAAREVGAPGVSLHSDLASPRAVARPRHGEAPRATSPSRARRHAPARTPAPGLRGARARLDDGPDPARLHKRCPRGGPRNPPRGSGCGIPPARRARELR